MNERLEGVAAETACGGIARPSPGNGPDATQKKKKKKKSLKKRIVLRIHRSTRERESGARSVPEAGARGCGAESSRREEEAGTSVTPLEGASKRPGRWVRVRGGDVPRAENLARVMWRWPPSWEEARPAAGTQGRQGRGATCPDLKAHPFPRALEGTPRLIRSWGSPPSGGIGQHGWTPSPISPLASSGCRFGVSGLRGRSPRQSLQIYSQTAGYLQAPRLLCVLQAQ